MLFIFKKHLGLDYGLHRPVLASVQRLYGSSSNPLNSARYLSIESFIIQVESYLQGEQPALVPAPASVSTTLFQPQPTRLSLQALQNKAREHPITRCTWRGI